MRTIFQDKSYTEVIIAANLQTLSDRREKYYSYINYS